MTEAELSSFLQDEAASLDFLGPVTAEVEAGRGALRLGELNLVTVDLAPTPGRHRVVDGVTMLLRERWVSSARPFDDHRSHTRFAEGDGELKMTIHILSTQAASAFRANADEVDAVAADRASMSAAMPAR